MTPEQFANATASAEEILNVYADGLDAEADWTQCWAEWFNGCFVLKIVYPPGTKKTKFRWLLKARRMLQRETNMRWLFVVFRLPKLTDHEILYRYRKLIEDHGGGLDEIDVDDNGEGL
tara:strand:- start:3751 stop:4104 length:354 start_codon:yes stop_codon:yes gene_type:complete